MLGIDFSIGGKENNMKRFVCFVNFPDALYNFTRPFWLFAFLLINMVVERTFGIFFTIVILLTFILFFLYRARPSYTFVFMDNEKIYNQHLTFKWQEIKEYRILEYVWREYYFPFKKPQQDILCIGAVEGLNYKSQSTKKCIMIHLSKNNLKRLQRMNAGKSSVINEVLSFYLREIPQKRKFGD